MGESNQRLDYKEYGLRIDQADNKNPLTSSQAVRILLFIACAAVFSLFIQRALFYDSVQKKDIALSVVNSSISVTEQTQTLYNVKSLPPVNINTADIDGLCQLKGIGKIKAQAIIDYRTENGAFTYPEELMNVSGIGESTFLQFYMQILLEDPTDPVIERTTDE